MKMTRTSTLAATALLSCGLVAGVSLPASAQAASPSESTASSVTPTASDAVLNVSQAGADGFTATVSQGSVVTADDGSLQILNAAGEVSSVLATQITLDDGTVRSVDYSISGATITASYSQDIVASAQAGDPAAAGAVTARAAASNGVDCGLALAGAGAAYLGGVGAALTAPFTLGGGLVVSGAAIAAGTAGVNAAYQCYGQ